MIRLSLNKANLFLYPIDECKQTDLSSLYKDLPEILKYKADLKATNEEKQIFFFELCEISKLLDISLKDISYTKMGKPITNTNKYFSVSHCKDYLLIALSNSVIGVDIQEMIDIDQSNKIANIICSDSEKTAYTASENKSEYLTKLFSQKESVIKCFGSGLIDMLDALQKYEYTLESTKYGNYYISVCLGK